MNVKIFRTIFRSFRDAFKSVVRNFSLSLASISCITITLIIVAFALMVSENVRNFTQIIEKDVTVVVFMDNSISDDEIATLKKQINDIDNVASISFKSKNDVKEEMQKSSDTFETILSQWSDEDNPLKDTFTLKVEDVTKIKETVIKIKSLDKVSTVQYGEGLVEKLVGVFDAAEKITIISAVALIVVTLFLIINTIKLTIFSRQEEIGIMRLVGASNSRIKFPFVVEGIVLGMIGSIIPMVIVLYGYPTFYNYFGGVLFSSLIKLINPNVLIYKTAIIVLIAGAFVGMIGSARAVKRYIKV